MLNTDEVRRAASSPLTWLKSALKTTGSGNGDNGELTPRRAISCRLTFTQLNLQQQPLLFLATAFIGGLLGGAKFSLPLSGWFILAASLWLIAGMGLFAQRGESIVTMLLLAGCFTSGGMWWQLNEAGVSESRVRKLFEYGELTPAEPVEVRGRLKQAPELAPDRIYLPLEVERVASLMRERAASGTVQLVVPFVDEQARADYDALQLDYGRRVRVLAYLTPARGYRNPGAPDFDDMLEHRGYDATGSIKSPLLIEPLGEGEPNRFLLALYHLRARAIAVILRSFQQPTSGLLVAALFGNRYFLSRETAEVFRASGTFHLLVISGLHVAMIAAVTLWVTARWIKSRLLRYGLVIVFLWSYAIMVGAQASVLRAVVMLSVALIAQLIFRTAIGANTLAAAALILLTWQPRELFNPAFQLSFLTVLIITTVVAPLLLRLQSIGRWRPTALTPYPPRAPGWVKWSAELLFWDEAAFRQELAQSPIRYRLDKARAASALSRTRLGRAVQCGLAWAAAAALTTTILQVALLPLMIAYFHRASLVSPIANVIESAMVFILMIAGGAYLLIYAISTGIALKLSGAINALGLLTANAASPLLQWRGANLRLPDYGASSASIYICFFALLGVLIVALNRWNPLEKGEEGEAKKQKFGRRTMVAISSAALGLLCWLLVKYPFPHQYEPGRLSLTFLDVGQGDAMLISLPRGSVMLIDSGGRPSFSQDQADNEIELPFVEDRLGIGEAAVAPYLWRHGIKRIDLLVITHGHADHMEGFNDIIRSFDIGAVLTGVISRGDAQFEQLRRAIEKAGVPLRLIRRGDGFELDGVRFEVLSPFRDQAASGAAGNNESLVLRISYGIHSFLLTGDIEREAEERLIAAGEDLRADVLKVAHHGSSTSSTAEFLQRVQPRYAVISAASPNPFGHPHPEVLDRLRQVGAQILQTSSCGAITISTNGHELRVSTFVKCQ